MSELQKKLFQRKTVKYGEIAIKLRRGLVTFDEAQYLWDQAEADHRDLLRVCENQEVAEIVLNGLAAQTLLENIL